MRFLVDQDVFAATARFLRSLGHDAILVSEIGLAQASDEKLLGYRFRRIPSRKD